MPGKRWTPEQEEMLRYQLIEEKRKIEDCEIPGKELRGMIAKAKRKGWISVGKADEPWTPHEIRLMRRAKKNGLSARDVFEKKVLGSNRNLNMIRKKWGRLELSDPQRAKAQSGKRNRTKAEREELDEYLKRNFQKGEENIEEEKPPELLARIWGISRSEIVRRQEELEIRRERLVVMNQMSYSIRKRKRKVKWEQRAIAKERRKRHRLLRRAMRLELQELAERLSQDRNCLEPRTCRSCGSEFYKDGRFFPVAVRNISGEEREWFGFTCTACLVKAPGAIDSVYRTKKLYLPMAQRPRSCRK